MQLAFVAQLPITDILNTCTRGST